MSLKLLSHRIVSNPSILPGQDRSKKHGNVAVGALEVSIRGTPGGVRAFYQGEGTKTQVVLPSELAQDTSKVISFYHSQRQTICPEC